MVYQVLHLFPKVGYPPIGGTPPARSDGGMVPEVGYSLARSDVGYPRWGTPQSGLMGGTQGRVTPQQGNTPCPGLMGWVPKVEFHLARADRGYLRWGTPSRGTPQPGLMGGT